MTREEAINQLQDAKDGYKEYLTDEVLDMAIEALEQELSIQELQAKSDKINVAFQDGYDTGYAQAKFDYEQEVYNKGYEDGVRSINFCPYCGEYIGEEIEE